MKKLTKLSREELKNVMGGLVPTFHYYCICGNGKTMNGSASTYEDMGETALSVCGESGGECFFA
jgi:hypothetical protein